MMNQKSSLYFSLMKSFWIVTFSLLFTYPIVAQIQNDFLNSNISRIQLKNYLPVKTTKFHSAIQPYEFLDSGLTVLNESIFKSPAKSLTAENKSQNFSLNLEPILGVLPEALNLKSPESFRLHGFYILGFKSQVNFKDKLHLRSSFFGGSDNISEYNPYGVIEGLGELGNSSAVNMLNYNAALTYTPNDIFAFQIGRGKHKFGDGVQSLLLSENAINYPYAKIRTRVWDIEYINLFSAQKSLVESFNPFSSIAGRAYDYKRKFTSSHLLSWNINQAVNVYFFETIIWQNEDTLSTRGFDINYLNPIIFFRPVEFAVGSSDNAIVGAGSSWKVNKKFQIYGQFVIDEMIFKRFINRTGWWANKYGAQLGFKVFDPFKTKDTYFQMEWNQVRPFTYSHGSPQQNYAHYNQPLAHPAGSNFYEFLALFVKDFNRFQLQVSGNFLLKGDDIPAIGEEPYQNLGGDIFRSYVDPFIDRGNVVGQGYTTNNFNGQVNASYIFNEKSDGRITLGYGIKHRSGETSDFTNSFINLGMTMNFSSLNINPL